MPSLNVSDLNVVISVLGELSSTLSQFHADFSGAFTILYGLSSVKIKNVWYLGEARRFSRSQTAKARLSRQYPRSSRASYWVRWQQSSSIPLNGELLLRARMRLLLWYIESHLQHSMPLMLITPDVGSLPCCHRRPARHGRLPTTSQVPADQMEGDVYLLDPQHDINVANDIGLCHGRNTESILRSSLRALI